MPGTIRFHLDEHISHAIAVGLRQPGIDVTTTPEVELKGLPDEEQLAFATGEGRVIVTSDTDFLRLHQRGVSHAGIVYYQQGRRGLGDVVRRLTALWQHIAAEEMHGRVEYL